MRTSTIQIAENERKFHIAVKELKNNISKLLIYIVY